MSDLVEETPQQAKIRLIGGQLKRIDERMENVALQHVNGTCGMPHMVTWRNMTQYAQLQKECETIDVSGTPLSGWQHEIVVKLKLRQQTTVSQTEVETEMLHYAAVKELEHLLTTHQPQDVKNINPEIWGGKTVTDLFGKPCATDFNPDSLEDRASPILTLLYAWNDLLLGGNTPDEATRTIMDDERLFRMLIGDKPADAGHDWHHKARQSVELALCTWTKRYHDLTADANDALVGISYMPINIIKLLSHSTHVDGLLIGALDWTIVSDGGDATSKYRHHGGALCHPTIAEYIVREHVNKGLSCRLDGPVKTNAAITSEDIRTTLILWEPLADGGAYKTLDAAFAAAGAL